MSEWAKGFMYGMATETVALFVGLMIIRYYQWKSWHS